MDLSSAEWFGQEIDEWQMMNATFDDFAVFSPETVSFPSSAGYCSPPFPPLSSSNGFQTVVENPAGAVNRVQEASSSSSIISFANSDLPWASQHLANCNPKGASVKTEMVFTSGSCVADGRKDMIGFGGAGAVKKGAAVRNAVQAQDHVMAERRRREKLTQCFIALSSLVPGLKKLDKASVLGAAIKHIKDLKERVETLEENAKRHAEEPLPATAAVKRVRLCGSDDDSSYSSDENSDASTEMSLPEIEVRSSDQNMLIRVHCKKHNGVIKEIFSDLEKMQLSILSSSVMPFGKTTTHITIIAQMDHKFCMAAKDVASTIRMTILKLLGCEESSSPF
ncbi:transcription factor NAI1-like [Ipomoea triloba]|uniref:transcription factor NAI1-like n=1 Tax=Ipomoea triloba TaxID=35885 RepID=UPI00125D931D|nr:transcription factor NAI1-like [Ipomoea triloba]